MPEAARQELVLRTNRHAEYLRLELQMTALMLGEQAAINEIDSLLFMLNGMKETFNKAIELDEPVFTAGPLYSAQPADYSRLKTFTEE